MPRGIVKVGRNTLGRRQPALHPWTLRDGEYGLFTRRIGRKLKTICDDLGAQFVFKASYDKANRTSVHSLQAERAFARAANSWLEVGGEMGVPVTTESRHSPQEVEIAAEYIDVIQVPAFLCRQTDLIVAAGASGRVVNVKKGQFLAPWDEKDSAVKLQSAGCRAFFVTERGATFGYNNLVADMRSIYWMQQLDFQVVFDATHCVQRPGGAGDRTGGDAELAPVLARAAVGAGCDGVFIGKRRTPQKLFPMAQIRYLSAIFHACSASLTASVVSFSLSLGIALSLPAERVNAQERRATPSPKESASTGKATKKAARETKKGSDSAQDIDIPVPEGVPVKGIKVPSYSAEGKFLMMLDAEQARKLERRHNRVREPEDRRVFR